jgi:hypothetical protein
LRRRVPQVAAAKAGASSHPRRTVHRERSFNAEKTISGYHDLTSPSARDEAVTGEYYDGNLYLARACLHLDFPGAAHHCTDGL